MTEIDAARAILRDAFDRVAEQVSAVTDGLSTDDAKWRPDPGANSIAWLIWHLTRVQDDHLADLAGTDQLWTNDGWHTRFSLPFDAAETGYGQSSDQVGQVVVDPADLAGYQQAVHRATLEYLDTLTEAELERVVDTRWDPPVTASVRLVSIVNDCTEHVGQAAYVKGMLGRR
ncbi:mycothiol transferase [Nakamurella lactea]|uniref:mycothiol transferase n=1 Tax=Nakamurella lactea TaxID=459515 RepID=UPI00041EAE87|nr:DinB family protein [Nakamurella lactea]